MTTKIFIDMPNVYLRICDIARLVSGIYKFSSLFPDLPFFFFWVEPDLPS